MAREPTQPAIEAADYPDATGAGWLVELAHSILEAGDPQVSSGAAHVAAFETRAAQAVQGLALQRAFARLECPITRIRLVQLVETIAAEQGRLRR